MRVSCFPSLDYVHVRIGSSAADKKLVEGKGVGIKVRPSSSTSTGYLINQVSCCVVPVSCSIGTNSSFSFSSIMVNFRLDISDDQPTYILRFKCCWLQCHNEDISVNVRPPVPYQYPLLPPLFKPDKFNSINLSNQSSQWPVSLNGDFYHWIMCSLVAVRYWLENN